MNNLPTAQDDNVLWQLAKSTISTDDSRTIGSASKRSIYQQLHSTVFVTAYFAYPLSSATVWCCMSNGDYDGQHSVYDNTRDSARICATRDPRRVSAPPGGPIEFEVTVLAPRAQWRLVDPTKYTSQLVRQRQRAIYVQLQRQGQRAVFLPSVWSERPEWDAMTLLDELAKKAGGKSYDIEAVYEIDVYLIGGEYKDWSVWERNRGYFDVATSVKLHALQFYFGFADYLQFRLPYLVLPSDKNKTMIVQYDNEGSYVRSLFDLKVLWKLLSSNFADSNPATPFIETALQQWTMNTPQEYAAMVQLRLTTASATPSQLKKDFLYLLSLDETHTGTFDKEPIFANPQIMITLMLCVQAEPKLRQLELQHISADQQLVQSVTGFLNQYIRDSEADAVSYTDAVFAANWSLQALSQINTVYPTHPLLKNPRLVGLIQQRIQICLQNTNHPRSVAAQAVSWSGLFAAQQAGWITNTNSQNLSELWLETLHRWGFYQQDWKIGAFRYFIDKEWYRTDITSHVIEAILLWSLR